MKKIFLIIAIFISTVGTVSGAETLYDYYLQTTGRFPSCVERTLVYKRYFSDKYICTAKQNIKLLNYLSSPKLGSGGVVVKPGTIGVPVISGTAGSALFIDANGNLGEDNTNFYWDNSNNRLGIADNTPTYTFDVTGNVRVTSYLDVSHFIATSTTATSTFAGGITVDTSDFVIDPDANKIGIGTTTPLSIFHIENPSATTTQIISSGGGAIGGRIILEDTDGAGCTQIYVLNGTITGEIVACPTGI